MLLAFPIVSGAGIQDQAAREIFAPDLLRRRRQGTGHGENATIDYAEELFEHWRTQAARKPAIFDTDRSVLIVLDVDNHQIAVHPGRLRTIESASVPTKVERDLIQKVFIKDMRAKSKYPEGLAAL